jgi:hemerythrin-like domain-containing protein
MRMEHVQMRELFDAMADAVKHQDRDEFLGQAETLLVMMQQHNMKEEQMLYRMADQTLAGEMEEVLQQMRAVGA